jgi:hypothetical protein
MIRSAPRASMIMIREASGVWPMDSAVVRHCRRGSCANSIPTALASEQLCLDHFLDEAFVRTNHTFTRCREQTPLTPADLEWLLTDALLIVKNLEEEVSSPIPEQRERMLDLLLMLANLHEYVAHHSVHLDRPA